MTLILGQTAVTRQPPKAEQGVIEIPLTLNPQNNPPNGFDATLWALLRDIKTAGVPLTGKVAEYAGYFLKNDATGNPNSVWDSTATNNKNNPDVPYNPAVQSPDQATGQPNKSLDKLTFLIMFRLPFLATTQLPNPYYDDPISGSTTSWSRRANDLRIGSLKKLNGRGEQVKEVNGTYQRCDDNGTLLDSATEELGTPASYAYYNQIGSNLTGGVANAVKNYAPYFYLAIQTEGKFKFPAPAGDKTLTVVTIPENIIGLSATNQIDPKKSTLLMDPKPELRRREVELGVYRLDPFLIEVFTPIHLIPSYTPYQVDQAIIRKAIGGAHPNKYFVTPPPGPLQFPESDRIYVQLKYDDEEIATTGTHFVGATEFELDRLKIEKTSSNPDVYYATYYNPNNFAYKFGFEGPGDIQFDNLAIVEQSGVTLGWGYDIGQGDRNGYIYQYNITFEIWVRSTRQPTGISHFKLRYKDRSSDPIAFDTPPQSATGPSMETALLKLLRLKKKPWPDRIRRKNDGTTEVLKTTQTIKVTKLDHPAPHDPEYTKGWRVTIVRANMDWNDYPLEYDSDNHTKRDFMEVPGENGFFNIYSSNIFYQQDDVNEPGKPNIMILPALEKERYVPNPSAEAVWNNFTDLLTDLFGGVNWKDASHFTGATGTDIDDFEALLRGCYGIRRGNAFLPVINHYSLMSKFKLPPVPDLYPRWVEKLERPAYYTVPLSNLPSDISSRMNAAERYVLITLWYRGNITKYNSFQEAIRTKSLSKLLKTVEDNNNRAERKKAILDNLNNHFKKHLYRNVQED